MALRALGTALATLCCSETQTKSTPRAYQRPAPSRCFLCEAPPGKGETPRNSHTSVVFWSPAARARPREAPVPKPDLCSLVTCISGESQSTECFFFPVRGGAPDSCPCCRMCLTNWQGQNTAPTSNQPETGPAGITQDSPTCPRSAGSQSPPS